MKMTKNTILITGGASGIGRALAEALQAQGNQVIIAGRRQGLLDEVTEANPGMKSLRLDIEDALALPRFVKKLLTPYPTLNVVINNAGVMYDETVADGDVKTAEAIIATNLLGPIRLTAALLPHLLIQREATLVNVSSGLAFVPLASAPTYSATKAAIHSYTQSLRYQLQGTTVQVVELAPPYVQTELQGAKQASDPMAMPLKDFITEVMNLFRANPQAEEILVENVKPMRFAETSGNYGGFFKGMNDAVVAHRKSWH
jgi:uncharacterized oxidoreductase